MLSGKLLSRPLVVAGGLGLISSTALYVLLNTPLSAVSCVVGVTFAAAPFEEDAGHVSCEFEGIDAGGFASELVCPLSVVLLIKRIKP